MFGSCCLIWSLLGILYPDYCNEWWLLVVAFSMPFTLLVYIIIHLSEFPWVLF